MSSEGRGRHAQFGLCLSWNVLPVPGSGGAEPESDVHGLCATLKLPKGYTRVIAVALWLRTTAPLSSQEMHLTQKGMWPNELDTNVQESSLLRSAGRLFCPGPQ